MKTLCVQQLAAEGGLRIRSDLKLLGWLFREVELGAISDLLVD